MQRTEQGNTSRLFGLVERLFVSGDPVDSLLRSIREPEKSVLKIHVHPQDEQDTHVPPFEIHNLLGLDRDTLYLYLSNVVSCTITAFDQEGNLINEIKLPPEE